MDERDRMQAEAVKELLEELIEEASLADPNLKRKLKLIYRWVKDVDPKNGFRYN